MDKLRSNNITYVVVSMSYIFEIIGVGVSVSCRVPVSVLHSLHLLSSFVAPSGPNNACDFYIARPK